MAMKIKPTRGTKSRIETVKNALVDYQMVYATDTKELGVKNTDGTISYMANETSMAELDGKLDKWTVESDEDWAYIKKFDGSQGIMVIDERATNTTLAKRTNEGTIRTADAIRTDDAVPLGQADGRYALKSDIPDIPSTDGFATKAELSGKLDKLTGTTTRHRVYTKLGNGNQSYIETDRAATGGTLVERESAGEVSTGTATQPRHAINLGQADGRYALKTEIPDIPDLSWTLIATDNSSGTASYITIPSGYKELYIFSESGGAPVLLNTSLINTQARSVQSLSGFKSSTVNARVLNPIATWHMSNSTTLRKGWVNGEGMTTTFYIYGR